jgi:hypothetical protein
VRCHNRVEPGTRYCEFCGAALKPSPWRPTAGLLIFAGLIAVLVIASTQVWRGLHEEEKVAAAAPPTTTTTLPPTSTTAAVVLQPTTVAATAPVTQPPAPPIQAVQILAGRPTPPAQNACKQVDRFDATNLQDGDFSTAWRVKGAAVGQQVRLRLNGPTHVTQVGLVPGWAKVDGCDGADLFRQLRTVARVRWVFDGGKSVEQALNAAPDLQLQVVDVVTRNVTMQILATNQPNGTNMTAISEIRLGGVPAG